VGDSPSLAATQNKCGRVAHTPSAVYYTRRVQWVKQAPQKQGAVATQMQRSVVAIETFPLMLRHLRQTSVGDEPKKKAHCNVQRALLEMRSEDSPRLSDDE